MSTETYDILYEVKGDAPAKIDALIARVEKLDAAVTKSRANMKGLGSGVGGGAGQAGGPAAAPGAPRPGGKADAGIGDMLPSLAAATMAIRALTGALDDMGEAARKAREFQDKGSQLGLDKRGKAREYANLMGHEGPDDAVMTRLFGLAKSGGYKFDEATKYGEQFLGSSPAGVQAGHVTPEQLQRLEVEGARFANRIGLDPATGGDVAGVVPQYVDMTKDRNGNPLTTEQGVQKAMGQLGALQYGLNEGRGKITTLMRGELGAAAPALAAGRIGDHAEMGAFVGIASTFSKSASSSGTGFKQMDNLINNAGNNYLDEIGVSGEKGDLNKLRALKKDLDARRTADPNFDVLAHLKEQGFSNRAERDATAAFVENFDTLEKRTVEARKRAGNGQDVIDANRRYSASLEGQNQLGDAAAESAEYDQTAKHQRTSVARKFALAQLRKEGKIDTGASNFEDWALDFTSGPTRKWSGEMESRATGVDARVRENLVKAARRAGVDLEKAYPGFEKGHGEGVNWTLDQVMSDVGPLLERGGVGLDGGDATPARAGRQPAMRTPPAEAKPDRTAGRGAPGGLNGFNGFNGLGGSSAAAGDDAAKKLDEAGNLIKSAARDVARGGKGSKAGGGEPPPGPMAGNGGAGANPGRR